MYFSVMFFMLPSTKQSIKVAIAVNLVNTSLTNMKGIEDSV